MVVTDGLGREIVPAWIKSGRKVVTIAGSRVQLAASAQCNRVILAAAVGNTGAIVVGGSDVVAEASSRAGVPLYAGDSMSINVSNLNLVYIDAEKNGEGVTFMYLG